MSMATPDTETEKCGIPCLLKDCNRRGACPEHARERSIRLLPNRPQLHEERSAVIATNVTTPAAASPITSTPPKAKTTAGSAARTPEKPLGRKPPYVQRLDMLA